MVQMSKFLSLIIEVLKFPIVLMLVIANTQNKVIGYTLYFGTLLDLIDLKVPQNSPNFDISVFDHEGFELRSYWQKEITSMTFLFMICIFGFGTPNITKFS